MGQQFNVGVFFLFDYAHGWNAAFFRFIVLTKRTAETNISSKTISATTRQALELESCLNPLRIRQVF